MIKILPITKAREELPKIVDHANRLFRKYVITVNGVPQAVIMSHEEHESLMETLDILSEPGVLDEIKKSEKELKQGKYVTLEELKDELGIAAWQMYELRIPQRVKKFIKTLPEKYRYSAISALDDIKSDPSLGKPLRRELKGFYSYQFGAYRFVYKFDKKSNVVEVVKLNHRRLVYN